ncbi:unnamed protein product, partial [marine sediment metagenome]
SSFGESCLFEEKVGKWLEIAGKIKTGKKIPSLFP